MLKSYLSLFKFNSQYFSDSKNNKLWDLVFVLAVYYNLIYVLAIIATFNLWFSFITKSVPIQAHINVLLFASIPISTIIINFKIFLKSTNIYFLIFGIILNLICFGYLLVRPEYGFFFIEILVLLGPILNIIILQKIFISCRISNEINRISV